jgi:hypothetical protein
MANENMQLRPDKAANKYPKLPTRENATGGVTTGRANVEPKCDKSSNGIKGESTKGKY